MLLYALTLAGVIALAAVGWLQRSREPGTYRYLVYGRLKTLLAALVLTGLFCSAVQLAIVLSNDYEGTRQALAPIQSRLRIYRALSRWFTLTGAQIATFSLAIVALSIAAFAGVNHSVHRFVSTWKRAYAIAAGVAFLALFGSMVASDDAFVQRLALAERHAKRIEQRYVDLVARASERLDQALTASLLSALNQDDQWRAIDTMWHGATRDMQQLRVAYPALYVPFEPPVQVARFPASPLIAIPERIAPVLAIGTGAGHDVRLERFAARFAGAEREDISPLQIARGQSIAGAIASTRIAWSEHNASLLEQDLGSNPDPLSNQTPDLAWRLAQRIGVAMYEEASPQDAAPRDWSALPWRFVKMFLDESVDDAARDRIAGFAQTELAAWLSGQKDWATAAAEYADNVGAELRDKAQAGRAARRQLAQPAVEHASAEYAAARAELNEDVRRYAAAASAQRWQALEQSWMAGASQLPPAPRDSAMKVLVRIRQMIDAQNLPLPRLALLGRIEEAWRTVVSPVAGDEPDATFASVAAAVIVGESLTLGSRRFADENRDALLKAMSEAAREHFGASIGREPKPSEGYKLDAYLQQMFADSRALTAAALQRLSRNADAAHRPLLLAASTRECEIAGNLTVSMLRDGWMEARSSRRLSIPCW